MNEVAIKLMKAGPAKGRYRVTMGDRVTYGDTKTDALIAMIQVLNNLLVYSSGRLAEVEKLKTQLIEFMGIKEPVAVSDNFF